MGEFESIMGDSNVTMAYDPFPRLTEFEATNLSPSPRQSPVKNEVNEVLSSPIIKKFDSDNLVMPVMSLKDSGVESQSKDVLVEWQPHSADSKEGVFVQWSGKNENLQDLEKAYLNLYQN